MPVKRLRRTTAAIAATLCVVAIATACSSDDDGADASSTGLPTGTLTIANSNIHNDFDPVNANDGQQVVYFQPVYDTLIRKQPDGSLTPMLATEWSYDDTQTELTLELRSDVTFSNGTVFDADAVVANIEHQMSATTSETFANVASVSGVDAADEDTVVITLTEADPGLLDALATNTGLIAEPTTLEDGSAATDPIGTGPYTLDPADTVVGDTYAYTAREDYWDPSLQKYGTIVIKYMADISARLNAIQSGQIDAAPIEIGQYDTAVGAGLTVQSEESNFSGLIISDRAGEIVPALGDERVRQAIAYAIDRESLVSAIIGDRGSVTNQLFAENGDAFVSELDAAYVYDVDKAKKLLDEAGYAEGFEVTIPDMSALFGADLYAALVDQLDAIGITVVLDSAPIPDLVQRAQAGQYAISYAEGQIGSDWYMVSTYYLPSGLQNQLGSTTPDMEDLISDIRNTSGGDQVTAYQALNEYVVDNAWTAPFFRSENLYASTDAVEVTIQTGHVVPYIYNYAPVD